jgi:hypothetical protein
VLVRTRDESFSFELFEGAVSLSFDVELITDDKDEPWTISIGLT